MDFTLNTPVLLITFNRPDLTSQVINVLRSVKPKEIFFASDGPRQSNKSDREAVLQNRGLLRLVDWDCEVKVLFHENNQGCKYAVSKAISWFFSHVNYGIILEDDCLPVVSFFKFCESLLKHYEHDKSVGIISGQNPFIFDPTLEGDYHFTKYATIWGWATWRRVWIQYDVEMSDWNSNSEVVLKTFDNLSNRVYWKSIFSRTANGKIDTWDYQLVYLLLKNRMKSIVPKFNLIKNIGFDERATHTKERPILNSNQSSVDINFPLVHPLENSTKSLDKKYEQHLFLIDNFFIYILRVILRKARLVLKILGKRKYLSRCLGFLNVTNCK